MLMRRRPERPASRTKRAEALDTVASWQPEAARVLTAAERKAFETMRKAVPNHMVLAQVPLSRFVRVPKRNSYSHWLSRVGSLNADLVVCDAASQALAVVDIRPAQQSERGRQRHERMARVLRAANISVLVWHEQRLPGLAEVRSQMAPLLGGAGSAQTAPRFASTGSAPLIPVAEMEEILAHGDMLAQDPSMEPVPSTLFDEFDPLPASGVAAAPGRL
ncbi:MAG: DUF2726 domain-containing protein [Burkholderiaceae bacterium]